jgi:hypothetical protein
MFNNSLWSPKVYHWPIFGTTYITKRYEKEHIACFTGPQYKDANGDFRIYFNGQSYAVK